MHRHRLESLVAGQGGAAHLVGHGCRKALVDDQLKLLHVVRNATTSASQCERWANNQWKTPDLFVHLRRPQPRT